MPDAARFPFTATGGAAGEAALMPYLPIALSYENSSVDETGLVDTGASVSVMPYGVGAALGAVWDEGGPSLKLSGNMANYEARPLVVTARVGGFAAVRLAFAWTKAEGVPLILGQVNFLMQYDVCFYRARRYFEVRVKS